jgi:hypothetical protein
LCEFTEQSHVPPNHSFKADGFAAA